MSASAARSQFVGTAIAMTAGLVSAGITGMAFAQDPPQGWQPLPDGSGAPVVDPCAAPWSQRRTAGSPEDAECPCPADDPCAEHCLSQVDGWTIVDCNSAFPRDTTVDFGFGRMSRLNASARITRIPNIPGLVCGCSAEATATPLVNISDHLELRMLPLATAQPLIMTFRAKASLVASAEIYLGPTPIAEAGCSNACGTVTAEATTSFTVPFFTPDIALELARKGSMKAIRDHKTHCGGAAPGGAGFGVGTSGVELSWSGTVGNRRLLGRAKETYDFKATSCLIPPTSGGPVIWTFRLDHGAEAEASLNGADKVCSDVSVETLQLAVMLEQQCASCSNPGVPRPPENGGHP